MESRFPCTPVGLEFFASAPHCFPATEIVKATPEQIFEVFEDAHAWTVWADPIQDVEWTSPKPFKLGTTRTVTMSGGMVGWEEFIAWEPGRRMAFCFTHVAKDNIESFAEDYQVEDLGDGTCKVTWRMAMAPKGASRFILPVFSPVMGWFIRRMFKKFKVYTENHAAGAVQNA